MNLNIKRVKIVGQVGQDDIISVTGSIPSVQSDNITLNFNVKSKTGQNYVRKHFRTKYKKWEITLEV